MTIEQHHQPEVDSAALALAYLNSNRPENPQPVDWTPTTFNPSQALKEVGALALVGGFYFSVKITGEAVGAVADAIHSLRSYGRTSTRP